MWYLREKCKDFPLSSEAKMLENEMSPTRLPKTLKQSIDWQNPPWGILICSFTTWRVCSRKNLLFVLYFSLNPKEGSRKLFLCCWWAAQGKYHHKLATPSVHNAFNKWAWGSSRTETHISPAAPSARVPASANQQCVQMTSFSLIFSGMPHFTPL